MRQLIFIVAMMFFTMPALADSRYDKCMDQSDGSNVAWGQCGGDWLKRADASLNQVWKKVYGSSEGQTKSDLLAEQRLWNSYKESSCSFYANGDWGREGQVLHFATCRAGIIESRTKQLREYGEFISGQ